MKVTITAPSAVTINYKIGNPVQNENIASFTLTSDPNPPVYWDDPQWDYSFNHVDGLTAVDTAYFIKWDDSSPPNTFIGIIKVDSTENVKYFAGLSGNPQQTADGTHSFKLKATSQKAILSSNLDITVKIEGKITPPAAAPPTQYFIIGTTAAITIPVLDYSTGIPPTKTVTLVALKKDNTALPNGITESFPAGNQISIKIDTTNVAHKNEYEIKVKATFADSTDETIEFKVFLMEVTFTLPTVTPITYKV